MMLAEGPPGRGIRASRAAEQGLAGQRTAIVVDNDRPARLQLRDLLARSSWLRWTGEARCVSEAQGTILRLKPDVVFLDISLPGQSGLDLANELSGKTPVVFTTASAQYAVEAFELGAADYLLKPLGRERFDITLDRLRAQLELPPLSAPPFLERLYARMSSATHCLPVGDIERIEAQDDYVAVYAWGNSYLVHITMAELERGLDPNRFARVHRRHIVNLDRVARLVRGDNGGEIHLSGGDVVRVSRTRIAGLPLRNGRGKPNPAEREPLRQGRARA